MSKKTITILGIIAVVTMIIFIAILTIVFQEKPEDYLSKIGTDKSCIQAFLNVDYQYQDAEMITEIDLIQDKENQLESLKSTMTTTLYEISGHKEHTYFISADKFICDEEEKEVAENSERYVDLFWVLDNLKAENFESYKLEDDINDTEKCISAKLSKAKFGEFISHLSNENIDSLNINVQADEKTEYKLMLVFDSKSKELTYIQLYLDNSPFAFKYIIQINSFTNTALSNPY